MDALNQSEPATAITMHAADVHAGPGAITHTLVQEQIIPNSSLSHGTCMQSFLGTLLQLCLVRGKPQDLQASTQFLVIAVAAYIITNLLPSLGDASFSKMVLVSAAKAVTTLAVLWIFLRVSQKSARFTQTAIAICGALAIAQLVIAPFAASIEAPIQNVDGKLDVGADLPLVPLLLLFVWVTAIMANILRHTFETTLFKAVLITWGMELLATFMLMLFLAPTAMGPATSS